MPVSKRLATVLAAAALLVWPISSLEARTKKGDQLYAQGREAEQTRQFDKALDFYEQALAADPTDLAYQMAYRRARFQAGQTHVDQAQKLRDDGKLEDALEEFQRAAVIDPSSPVAAQELRRTMEMIDQRDRQLAAGVKPEERPLPPGTGARREVDEKLAAVMSVPELRALSALPQNLRINNQTPRVMFETVTKLAGVNVLFDQDFNTTVNQAASQPGAHQRHAGRGPELRSPDDPGFLETRHLERHLRHGGQPAEAQRLRGARRQDHLPEQHRRGQGSGRGTDRHPAVGPQPPHEPGHLPERADHSRHRRPGLAGRDDGPQPGQAQGRGGGGRDRDGGGQDQDARPGGGSHLGHYQRPEHRRRTHRAEHGRDEWRYQLGSHSEPPGQAFDRAISRSPCRARPWKPS